VTQRTRFTLYLVIVHLLLAAAGVVLFLRNPAWLFAAEAVLVVSAALGMTLAGRLFSTMRHATGGSQLMRDGDFSSRLLPVGQPEADQLIALYNDMADRLREQRVELQEQQHFLADVLRVCPAGIIVLDFDGRVVSVNPAAERLLGRTLPEITGVTLDRIATPLPRSLATLHPGETTVVTTSAGRRIRCHHGAFQDRGFRRSFILIEELTEELRHAERSAYEKLIRVMAHEVNNSVTASNSLLTSSLNYGPELSSESRGDFDAAIRLVIQRTGQLNVFMRSFADVFRLPAPITQDERVVDLLESSMRLVRARPDAQAVSWRSIVDDDDLTLPLDRGQMEQALINVLQNAVEAQARTVIVRLESPNGRRPTLHIEDDGQGFDAETESNLFTPFFSTKPNGQGIGLTLVREILSAHGFDYSVRREPTGITTFTVVF
jgi:two-component system, NtrC family, nitrogen regulation sensor histidine kinase NtrY